MRLCAAPPHPHWRRKADNEIDMNSNLGISNLRQTLSSMLRVPRIRQTNVEKAMNHDLVVAPQPRITRRAALKGVGLGLGAAGLSGITGCPMPPVAENLDAEIFTFALNLEYLEAEYYNRAARGRSLTDLGVAVGAGAGSVTGGRKVIFTNQAFQDYADELAANETAHVNYYRQVLGGAAPDRPQIDFEAGFNAAARSAGLVGPNESFDAFANETNFFLGGMLFEDVGVTAYRGAAPLITDKGYLASAGGILAVEAYHMGLVRSLLFESGAAARSAANAISDARDALDGELDLDQGIDDNGRANIVPTDQAGLVFARTPRQVLNIVYLAVNGDRGGFYPQGFNGNLSGLVD